MRSSWTLRFGVLAGAVALAAAECPNACSGHGTCAAYDMCTCYYGYMANDCSERICPFGLSHVDSPKGDLNMDNSVEFATVIPDSQMYEGGTSELFPIMETSDGTSLIETGHYYMECSNKGLCDRTAATCACFTGYEGHACQRASCPNECSGHGVCKTNRELAFDDHLNVYELWDADLSLACDCDPGYDAYDCSERLCPVGIDPLWIDDENTARVSQWTFHFEDAVDLSMADGTWRLRFFDVYGEDWITGSMNLNTTCDTLEEMLTAIPNDVVHDGTIDCTKIEGTYVYKFELAFTGNPGYLKPPEIITTDEAGRDTLRSGRSVAYAGLNTTAVYDTGIVGEFYDYFGFKCGVTITASNTAADVLGAVQVATVTSGTVRMLKECLGDANGVMSDNVGVENWDFGAVAGTGYDWEHDVAFPDQFSHLVKLVNIAAASEFEGGVHAIMYWNDGLQQFQLSTSVDSSTDYRVFASAGVLERVWYDSDLDGSFSLTADELGTAYWTKYESTIYTSRDFSCENAGNVGASSVYFGNSSYLYNNCIEKGDMLVLPRTTAGLRTENVTGDADLQSTQTHSQNTPYTAGIYEVMKISEQDYTATTNVTEDRYQIVLDRPVFWDGTTTAQVLPGDHKMYGIHPFYRFTPNLDSGTDQWVAECSNRGLCDHTTGLCTCAAGYTNENCDTQSALAV